MDESPLFSKYECFDYQTDFTQFLQEAKKNINEETLNTTNLKPETNKQLNGEKKNKKSWKKSLFSWLKTDKKSKSTEGSKSSTKKTNSGRRIFSGPVQVTRGPVTNGRARKSTSGPLTGIFSSTKGVEDSDVSYICLGQFSNSRKLRYGPVYLVT